MMKFTVILLVASVLLFNVVRAEEMEHDHPHNVGVADCACPTTLENLPVCGSNGVTYSNPGSLECAKNCGHTDLTIAKMGHC